MSKPQRRKGNAKAASSAHAADLLAMSGQSVPFIGFDGGFTNVFEKEEEVSSELDADVVLVLKKLAKKDPQTREKALRELLDVLSTKDDSLLELCFTYYASIHDKLSLDGSPTVRVLSTKLVGFFISKLKKAAEKHLPKIIPFVLLAGSDLSNAVCSQSETLLKDCFPAGKDAKVVSLFAATTASIAVDLISRRHPLVPPQKYDEDEHQDQRDTRLTAQSLQTLSRLSSASAASTSPDFLAAMTSFFADAAALKRLLKSSVTIQASLISLAMQMPDSVQVLMDSPVLSAYVMANLDSPEPSLVKSSGNAFVALMKDDRFFLKTDLNKTIIPRILNVVRKKKSHWSHLSPHLLPSMALVMDRLSDDVTRQGFAASFLQSFLDQLPFESSVSMPVWSSTLCECIRYSLTRLPADDQKNITDCTAVILSALDALLDYPDPDGSSMTSLVQLIHWIGEKEAFGTHMAQFVCLLQLNMINKRPSSDRLLSQLLSPCAHYIRLLHLGVLRVPPTNSDFIAPLVDCSDEYHDWIHKELDIISLVLRDLSATSPQLAAAVIVRALRRKVGNLKALKLPVDSDLSRAVLLLSASTSSSDERQSEEDAAWDAVTQHDVFPGLLSESISQWMADDCSQSAITVLNRLQDLDRANQVQSLVDSFNSSSRSSFIASILNSVQIPHELRSEASTKLLYSVLDPANVTDVSPLVSALAIHPPPDDVISTVLIDLVNNSGALADFVARPHGEMCIDDSSSLSSRINSLMEANLESFAKLLCSADLLTLFTGILDRMDTFEVSTSPLQKHQSGASSSKSVSSLAIYLPLSEGLFVGDNDLYQSTADSDTVDLQAALAFARQFSILASIYAKLDMNAASLSSSSSTQQLVGSTLAFLSLQPLIGRFVESIDPFHENDITRDTVAAAEQLAVQALRRETITMDDGAAVSASRYLVLMVIDGSSPFKQSPSIHLALRLLANVYHDAVKQMDLLSGTGELSVSLYWSLRLDCSRLRSPAIERWISRYHCSSENESPLAYLSHLREHIQTNSPEWEGELFNVSCSDPLLWRLSSVSLLSAERLFRRLDSPQISSDVIDFVLCGLVTVLDSCDAVYVSAPSTPTTLSHQCLLTSALRLYTAIADFARNRCHDVTHLEQFVQEWSDFFCPTLSRIVYRLWSHVKPVQVASPVVVALCEAVAWIDDIPSELGLAKTYTPELDHLKYDPSLQTLIVSMMDLLQCDNSILSLTALKTMRLLSPMMYRHENGEWSEEEKISSSGPRRQQIPLVLRQSIQSDSSFSALLALDAALEPLRQGSVSCDEERVALCGAFSGCIGSLMTTLVVNCPQQLPVSQQRNVFFACAPSLIDDVSNRKYLKTRFVCHLLYKLLSTVPAVVRSWYNGLSNKDATTIKKYVSAMCSELLIEDEMLRVKRANKEQLANEKLLKIRVVPAARQIVAEYVVEETTMRLSIEMANDYPLTVPTIQLDKTVVASDRAKKWLLQLTAYLYHQNGSSVDGILMWRTNVDRGVEGAEACCICMMTIHSTSHQLPKVKCRQCKNKFHSNCLYKWFESSNQSSCPLCRTNFT